MKTRFWTGSLAAVLAAGTISLSFAVPVQAANSREKGWRIGTYAAGAGTIAALAAGKPGWALVGAGAGLLSYSQWRREVRRRHRRERYSDYVAYRRAWYRRHHHYRRHHRH